MDFKPFDVPPSDYHPLATGLGDEGGVTPRKLVAGINAYLAHLFAAIEGKAAPVEKVIKAIEPTVLQKIAAQSDRIAKLEQDVAMLENLLTSAQSTPQAPIEPQPPQSDGSHPMAFTPAPDETPAKPLELPPGADPNSLAALLAATGGGKAG